MDSNLPPLDQVSAIVDAELDRWLKLKANSEAGKQLFVAGDWIAVNTARTGHQMSPEGREAIAAAQRRRWAMNKRGQRQRKSPAHDDSSGGASSGSQ